MTEHSISMVTRSPFHKSTLMWTGLTTMKLGKAYLHAVKTVKKQ